MFIQVFNLKGFNYIWLLRADSTDRLYVDIVGDKLWIKSLDVFTVKEQPVDNANNTV